MENARRSWAIVGNGLVNRARLATDATGCGPPRPRDTRWEHVQRHDAAIGVQTCPDDAGPHDAACGDVGCVVTATATGSRAARRAPCRGGLGSPAAASVFALCGEQRWQSRDVDTYR